MTERLISYTFYFPERLCVFPSEQRCEHPRADKEDVCLFFCFPAPFFCSPPLFLAGARQAAHSAERIPQARVPTPPPHPPPPRHASRGVCLHIREPGGAGPRPRPIGRPAPLPGDVTGAGWWVGAVNHSSFSISPPSPGLRLLGRPSGCASPSGRGGVPEGRLLRDRARGSPLARCSPCEEGEEICRFWFLLPVANTVGASRGVPLGSRRVGANTSQPKEGFGQPFGKGETATCTTASARNFCHFFRIA